MNFDEKDSIAKRWCIIGRKIDGKDIILYAKK